MKNLVSKSIPRLEQELANSRQELNEKEKRLNENFRAEVFLHGLLIERI